MLKLLQALIVKQVAVCKLLGELAKSVFGKLGWVHVEAAPAVPRQANVMRNIAHRCVLCGHPVFETSPHMRSPDGEEYAHWDTLCWMPEGVEGA